MSHDFFAWILYGINEIISEFWSENKREIYKLECEKIEVLSSSFSQYRFFPERGIFFLIVKQA